MNTPSTFFRPEPKRKRVTALHLVNIIRRVQTTRQYKHLPSAIRRDIDTAVYDTRDV